LRIHVDAILAAVLRAIQRAIGRFDQQGGRHARRGHDARAADADRHVASRRRMRVLQPQRLHREADLLAEQPRGARRRGRHHDRELLAAETRGEIARLRETALDRRGYLPEHAVARHVPVRVVVQLEVVDVDHQQRQLAALARARRHSAARYSSR
jgi:hypothetical protein